MFIEITTVAFLMNKLYMQNELNLQCYTIIKWTLININLLNIQ